MEVDIIIKFKVHIKKAIKQATAFLMIVIVILSQSGIVSAADKAEAVSVRLAGIKGSGVNVLTGAGKSVKTTDNMRLLSGYNVETDKASYAYMSLDDTKIIKTDINTEVEIRKKGKKNEVFVKAGQLFFNVTEKLDSDESLTVSTSNMSLGIRGSSGMVSTRLIVDRNGAILYAQVTVQFYEGTGEVWVRDPNKGTWELMPLPPGSTLIIEENNEEGFFEIYELKADAIPLFVIEELLLDREELGELFENGTGISIETLVELINELIKNEEAWSELREQLIEEGLLAIADLETKEQKDENELNGNLKVDNTGEQKEEYSETNDGSSKDSGSENTDAGGTNSEPTTTVVPPIEPPTSAYYPPETEIDDSSLSNAFAHNTNVALKTGQTAILSKGFTLTKGSKLTLEQGASMIIDDSGTAAPFIIDGTLINNGNIQNDGAVYNNSSNSFHNYGKFINNGTFTNAASGAFTGYAGSAFTNNANVIITGGTVNFGDVINCAKGEGTIQYSGGAMAGASLNNFYSPNGLLMNPPLVSGWYYWSAALNGWQVKASLDMPYYISGSVDSGTFTNALKNHGYIVLLAGSNVTLDGTVSIETGQFVLIETGALITVMGELNNNGDIIVSAGGAINGKLSAILKNNGTIIGADNFYGELIIGGAIPQSEYYWDNTSERWVALGELTTEPTTEPTTTEPTTESTTTEPTTESTTTEPTTESTTTEPTTESTTTEPTTEPSSPINNAFTDTNFLAAVREIIGKPNGNIYPSDVAAVTTLDVSAKGIVSLAGIEHFTALEELNCYNNQLTALDVSKNIMLQWLNCSNNNMVSDADVIGWQSIGLTLDSSFIFAPQKAVARINTTDYTSLAEAFSAALTGQTVELLRDATLTNSVSINSLYIDTKDFMMTVNRGVMLTVTSVLYVKDGATLNLTNYGTINASISSAGAVTINNETACVIKGISIDCSKTGVANITNNGEITMENYIGSMQSGTNEVIMTIINNGTIKTPTIIHHNTADVRIINNGQFEVDAITNNSNCTMTIDGTSSISLTTEFSNNGNMIIKSTVTIESSALFNNNMGGIIIIAGTIKTEGDGLENNGRVNIVSGGSLNIVSGGSPFSTGNGSIMIDGGSISGANNFYDASENLITATTNGLYEWNSDLNLGSGGWKLNETPAAKIGTILYPTLESALKAASTGQTVELLMNNEVNIEDVIYQNINANLVIPTDVKLIVTASDQLLNYMICNGNLTVDGILIIGNGVTLQINHSLTTSDHIMGESGSSVIYFANNASLSGLALYESDSTTEITDGHANKTFLWNVSLLRWVMNENAITDAFTDSNFLTAVRTLIEKPTGNIYPSDVADIIALDVSDKVIASLAGIEHFTALEVLNCYNNQLTELDVSKNTALTYLHCYNNQLTELDLSNNPEMRDISCYGNQLTSLNLSNNTMLTHLECRINQLTALDVSNTALTYLNCSYNNMENENVVNRDGVTTITTFAFYPQNPGYPQVSPTTDITDDFADANFLAAVREIIGKPTGAIYPADLLVDEQGDPITTLYVGGNNISSLAGIEHFTALTTLYCYDNQLTSLNLSNNTLLAMLDCGNSQLTELDLSNNTKLTELYCFNNKLTELELSNNIALTYLDCYNNQLKTLDLSNNTALEKLFCNDNELTELGLSTNIALTYLDCYNNQLTALDVLNTALTWLNCSNNNMTSTGDVIGWQSKLILGDTFIFNPQNPGTFMFSMFDFDGWNVSYMPEETAKPEEDYVEDEIDEEESDDDEDELENDKEVIEDEIEEQSDDDEFEEDDEMLEETAKLEDRTDGLEEEMAENLEEPTEPENEEGEL